MAQSRPRSLFPVPVQGPDAACLQDGQHGSRRHQSAAGIDYGEHRHIEPARGRTPTGDPERAAVELVVPAEPGRHLPEEPAGHRQLIERPVHHPQVRRDGFRVGSAGESIEPAPGDELGRVRRDPES
jgi:hypothetical protein